MLAHVRTPISDNCNSVTLLSKFWGALQFFLTTRKEIFRPSGITSFEITSEDPLLNLSFRNKELLERYAGQFRLSDEMGIGILINDPYRIEWVSPEKIVIVFSSEPRRLVDIYGPENQPFVTFEPVFEGKRKDTVYLYFNYDFSLIDDELKQDIQHLEKSLSASIVSIFYRITHYGPKDIYKEEELQGIMQEVYGSEPIINLELL